MAKKVDPVLRFNARHARGAPDECWPWLGALLRCGHGQHWVDGKKTPAHRYALKLAGIEVPADMLACHRCNNAKCVNPAHLYVGTKKDNARDAIAAGTFHFNHAKRGERHHFAKVTLAQVEQIRERKRNGESLRSIAPEYGLSPSQLSNIWRGRSWSCQTSAL